MLFFWDCRLFRKWSLGGGSWIHLQGGILTVMPNLASCPVCALSAPFFCGCSYNLFLSTMVYCTFRPIPSDRLLEWALPPLPGIWFWRWKRWLLCHCKHNPRCAHCPRQAPSSRRPESHLHVTVGINSRLVSITSSKVYFLFFSLSVLDGTFQHTAWKEFQLEKTLLSVRPSQFSCAAKASCMHSSRLWGKLFEASVLTFPQWRTITWNY